MDFDISPAWNLIAVRREDLEAGVAPTVVVRTNQFVFSLRDTPSSEHLDDGQSTKVRKASSPAYPQRIPIETTLPISRASLRENTN